MQTVAVKSQIDPDGRLHLDIPVDLPAGPVEVVVVIQPERATEAHDIRELRGLGKEIWTGIDAQEYVDGLRGE